MIGVVKDAVQCDAGVGVKNRMRLDNAFPHGSARCRPPHRRQRQSLPDAALRRYLQPAKVTPSGGGDTYQGAISLTKRRTTHDT